MTYLSSLVYHRHALDEKESQLVPPYADRGILIGGVVLFTLLGTFLGTYHSLSELFSVLIAKKLGFNFFIILLGWLLVRAVVQYFDQRLPWRQGSNRTRWQYQITASFFVAVIIFLLNIYVRTWFIPEWKYLKKTVWLTDFPLTGLFVLLINFLYYYLATRHTSTTPAPIIATAKQVTTIEVIQGKRTILLPIDQVAYAFRQADCNFVLSAQGERYLLDYSLSTLQAQVSDTNFFRLNRQMLVHRQAIIGFDVRPNRQLAVSLQPPVASSCSVSKNRSAEFKRWLKLNPDLLSRS